MNYQNYQNSMFLTSSDTKHTLMHLFLVTKKNWFQYVRRVYVTPINSPCIITLAWTEVAEIQDSDLQ